MPILLLSTIFATALAATPPAERDPLASPSPASRLPTDPDLAPAPRARDLSPPMPQESTDRSATPVPPATSPSGPAAQPPRAGPPARAPAEAASTPQSSPDRDSAPRNTDRQEGPAATAPQTPAPTVREPRS